MKKQLGMGVGLVWGVVAAGAIVAGAAAVDDKPAAKIDAAAEKALRALASTLQTAKTVSCEMTLVMTTESEGMKQEVTTTYGFASEPPNKLALRHKAGMVGNTVVCDGKKMFVYVGARKLYEQKPAPASFEELFQSNGPMAGNMLFIDNLLRTDVYAAIMESVNKVESAGTEKVGGQECQHLRFSQEQFDWDLWLTPGDKPVVVRIQTDMSKGFEAMSAQMPGMKPMKMTAVNSFRNWVLGGPLPEDAFVFTPPEGARKVDSAFAAVQDDEEGEAPGTLIGQKAPPFDLSLLDGGSLRVPDPKLTNAVIVLDFWATWCGPCQRALPILAKVTSEYAGKGVVFCAVNQQEQPERIKDYLKKNGIACPVALDEDGKAGTLYKLRGIPQTVLIGKDGTVQAVHVGLLPDLEKKIRAELDALVAGKKLPVDQE